MEHIVHNVIQTERLVDARKALRQEGKEKFENKETRRGTHLSQLRNKEDTQPASVEACQGVNSVISRVMWQNNATSNQARARYAIKLFTSHVDVFYLIRSKQDKPPIRSEVPVDLPDF